MKEIRYQTISDFHRKNDLSPPEHPMFTILHTQMNEDEIRQCQTTEESEDPIHLSTGYYSISLKNIVSGEIVYGRTKYDCENGALLFTAPNQTMVFHQVAFSSEAYHIGFHKEYILGTPLFEKLKKYTFFNYQVNEALHLSTKEEGLIKNIFSSIKTEYHNNQDEFSKDIILSHLETLLKYADRFYKRQFLNRHEINKTLFMRFSHALQEYFESGQLEANGIPTVESLATQLGVSHRYMSDTIKAQTGKTAVDQINLYLIEEARNLLLTPDTTVSETAYKLGFQYPQYFSRLFKKKTGVSPKEYMEGASLN